MVVHRKLCASLEPRVLLFLPLDPWTLGGEDEQRHSTSKTWRMVSSLVMLQWSLGLRVRYLGAVQDDLREAVSCGIPYQQRQGTKVSTLAQPRTLNSLPGTIARNPEPLLMNSPSGTPLPRTGSGMMLLGRLASSIHSDYNIHYLHNRLKNFKHQQSCDCQIRDKYLEKGRQIGTKGQQVACPKWRTEEDNPALTPHHQGISQGHLLLID
ncbi:uncharacterized protein LOC125640914 isoform X2 [Caretta caretta]|uniref:uncharacterized protein LOC125640914 isoform X2 n=1 Tax=Caretta caretta TaxID=8467 RepID=UPI003F4B6640